MGDFSVAQVTVTPTLDTNIYANNDRLGSIFTITDATSSGGFCEITDVMLVDSALQSVSIDILIFNALPTVASADNAAISIADAETAGKLIGSVSLLTGNYKSLTANSYVQGVNLGIFAKPVPVNAQAPSKDLYGLMVVRSGTPTYAADSIKLTFKLKQF